MRQISKIHFTPEGEVSNYFNFLKKFEIRTERSTLKNFTNTELKTSRVMFL